MISVRHVGAASVYNTHPEQEAILLHVCMALTNIRAVERRTRKNARRVAFQRRTHHIDLYNF